MRRYLIPFLLLIAGACTFANTGDREENGGSDGIPVDMETVDSYNDDLDYAQVVSVKAALQGGGTWRFDVAVRHSDEGWDHYADRWQVMDPEDSTMYGERVLAHPHDDEQPFTRSQSGIAIPDAVTKVLVRARCTDHGFEGRAILVDLSSEKGDGYTVIR